jgi:hypothetical protein
MTIEQAKRTADQVTGISNVTYDLISIVHNKLQAVAAIEGYRRDAEANGDQEVVDCFDRIVQHETDDLQELRRLLSSRLS